jgi:serine/threonine protein kinase
MNNALINIAGYTIHGILGQGGMAEVYLATQDSLRRKVAIKVLLNQDDDPSFNQRFINEGHLIASLHHPAIITIYDINQLSDGRYYLAMEFVGGGDLTQYKGLVFEPLRALQLIKQLAEGLQVVHEKGLVHRDIKPANILFRHSESVVITDFGIAKNLHIDSELTQQGIVVGSPSYSSPEQAQCQAVDQRTDIYSLGVILLEMLTGTNLYRGENYTQTVLNHVQMPIPSLPLALRLYQPLLDKMLAKNPDHRFANCQDLLDFLVKIQQPSPTAAAPNIALSQRLMSQVKDLSARLKWSVVGVIVLVVGLAVSYPIIQKKMTISRYLTQAEADFLANKLMSPAQDNADYHYRQVLLLDPSHSEAQEGLKKVLAARVAQALALAETNMANGQLLTPVGDNAVASFRQVLALSANHPLALQGLHRVATIYMALSKENYEKKAYEEALKNINLGLSAESTHAELLQMRAQHTDYVSSLKKTKSSAVNAHKKSRNKAKKTPSTAKNPLKNFWDKLRGR